MVFRRKKFCRYCAENAEPVDYKDTHALKNYLTETGKLVPSRITGNCAKHQRWVSTAVKVARLLALLPYCDRHQ